MMIMMMRHDSDDESEDDSDGDSVMRVMIQLASLEHDMTFD